MDTSYWCFIRVVFWLLGAVFLCTTGAEALYSDLGHCGRSNIRIELDFCQKLSAAELLRSGCLRPQIQRDRCWPSAIRFTRSCRCGFLPFGIGIATVATVIASQAMLSGAFTLISEAHPAQLLAQGAADLSFQPERGSFTCRASISCSSRAAWGWFYISKSRLRWKLPMAWPLR